MNKKNKKTKGKTNKGFTPGDFKTRAEAEEAAEEYIQNQPIYNYFQFFIGGPNRVKKNKQEGKPNPPY